MSEPRYGTRRLRQLRQASRRLVPSMFVIPASPLLPAQLPLEEREAAWQEFELMAEFLVGAVDRRLLTEDPAAAVRQIEEAYQELIRRSGDVLRSTFIFALDQALTVEDGALTETEFATLRRALEGLRAEVPSSLTAYHEQLAREEFGYQQIIEREAQELAALEAPYAALNVKPLAVDRFVVQRADLRAAVNWLSPDGPRPLAPDLLLDVFRVMRVGPSVPRIDVQAPPQTFIKVFDQGPPPEPRESKRQTDRRRTQYLSFTVVLRGRPYSAVWSAVDGLLVVAEVEWSRLAEVAKLIESSLPLQLLLLPSGALAGEMSYKIRGGFRPWSWFGLVLTNPAYASFYINENKSPAALNPAWNFVYRDDQLIPLRFRAANGDLTVSYHRAPSYAALERLTDLLGLLLAYLNSDQSGWLAFFEGLGLPDNPAKLAPTGEAKVPAAKPRISELKESDPAAFGQGYSSECTGKRQPVLVEAADRAAVEAETFRYENRVHRRQVMEFPLEDPRMLLTCPEGDYPFPGLVTNKGENALQYPYLPCCFSHDEINNPSSRYNQYLGALEYRAGLAEQKGSRGTGLVRTRKAIQPGQHGEIGGAAPALFARLAGLTAITIQRVGLPVDHNTMLAGLLMATTGRLPTAEAAARERKRLAAEFQAGRWPLAALAQEQYDWTEGERLAHLSSPTEPLGTDRWLRLGDLAYDVNLIVLVITKAKAQKETEQFEQPRHLGTYIRAWNPELPTVVLVTNPQVQAPVLVRDRPLLQDGVPVLAPVYDLLAWTDQIEDTSATAWNDRGARLRANRYIFPPEFSAALQAELGVLEPAWMWRPGLAAPVRNPFTSDSKLNTYFNQLAERGITGQLIDSFGKCRGVLTDLGLVYMPPAAPLPVPQVEEKGSQTLAPWLRLLGEPTAVGTTGAYWATDYFPLGLYVPGGTEGVPLTVPLIYVPPPSLQASQAAPPSRRSRLQRMAHFVQQLILWLVRIELVPNQDFNPDAEAKRFSERYLLPARRDVTDSLTAYDFRAVPRELPLVTSIAAGLRAAAAWRTGFLSAEGLQPYNEAFRRALQQEVTETYRRARSHLPALGPWRYIRDYYADVSDFDPQPQTIILSGPEQLAQWIEQLATQDHTVPYTEVPNLVELTRPYLYQTAPEGDMLLVQNVLGGELARAAAVAQAWAEATPGGEPRQVNLGYRAEPLATVPPVATYSYDVSVRGLVLASGSADAGLALLRYPDGSYAALLGLQTATVPAPEPAPAPLPAGPLPGLL